MVTATVEPGAPVVVSMVVMVGGGAVTVNVVPLLTPALVATVTTCAPTSAAPSMMSVALAVSLPRTLIFVTATPAPSTPIVVPPSTKLVPVKVTSTVAPATAVVTLRLVMAGGEGETAARSVVTRCCTGDGCVGLPHATGRKPRTDQKARRAARATIRLRS
jgi:hypothetical protein